MYEFSWDQAGLSHKADLMFWSACKTLILLLFFSTNYLLFYILSHLFWNNLFSCLKALSYVRYPKSACSKLLWSTFSHSKWSSWLYCVVCFVPSCLLKEMSVLFVFFAVLDLNKANGLQTDYRNTVFSKTCHFCIAIFPSKIASHFVGEVFMKEWLWK